jgi:hypothetical protein
MPIWTCPKCGCNDVATVEWHEVTGTYYDTGYESFEASAYESMGGTCTLVFAQCNDCDYRLTNAELAPFARSVGGLVLPAPGCPFKVLEHRANAQNPVCMACEPKCEHYVPF